MAYDLKSNKDQYDSVISSLVQSLPGATAANSQAFTDQTNQHVDQFSNLFKNFVGRDPTADEQNQFVKEYILPNTGTLRNSPDPTKLRNDVTGYISDTFQQQAKDTATQNLTDQKGQATDLASQFREQGKSAISSTEGMLSDYASRLFERLRPALMTSLQSQGLLDTGALNEATAGAEKDLAASSQGFLADANLNLENQANQIQFGGASAPYLYQQAQYQNQVPYLQSQGAGALNFSNQESFANLNFSNQMQLLNQQLAGNYNMAHPGFGTTFNQSFGQGLGSGLGENLTANLNGPAWNKGNGGGGLPSFGG